MAAQNSDQRALDRALKSRVEGFARASSLQGLDLSVHSRPTVQDWAKNAQSFAQKMLIGVSLVALGYAATQMAVNALKSTSERNLGNPSAVIDTAVDVKSNAAQSSKTALEQPKELEPWETPRLERARGNLQYMQVRVGSKFLTVLEPASRIELVKAAAADLELAKSGLSWKDLYGVIHAETGWVPRDGIGANGVVSRGLAQFEPATAKSIGLKNPNDEVQAVWAAANMIKIAASWSQDRVKSSIRKGDVHLNKKDVPAAVKEGVSIYYNTSTSLRNTWTVSNTAEFPKATRNHIANVADGAKVAEGMDKRILGHLGGFSLENVVHNLKTSRDAASSERSAKSLLLALDSKCEVQSKLTLGRGLLLRSSCPSPEMPLVEANYGDSVVVGVIAGVNVYLSINPNGFRSGAAVMYFPNTEDTVIMVDRRMVDAINNSGATPEVANLALRFVLAHEVGHIKSYKKYGNASLVQSMASERAVVDGEIAVDRQGVQDLLEQGFSPLEVRIAASTAYSSLYGYILQRISESKETPAAASVATDDGVQQKQKTIDSPFFAMFVNAQMQNRREAVNSFIDHYEELKMGPIERAEAE